MGTEGKTTSEVIADVSKKVMEKLHHFFDYAHKQASAEIPLPATGRFSYEQKRQFLQETHTLAAVEQVRATYVLATVLGDILTELQQLRYELPDAGRGH